MEAGVFMAHMADHLRVHMGLPVIGKARVSLKGGVRKWDPAFTMVTVGVPAQIQIGVGIAHLLGSETITK
jgi:hypothetical protein